MSTGRGKLMSGPPRTPRGSLARAFSLDSFARPLRSVHDFIDDFPLGSRPRNSGQPGSTYGESCKPGGERRVPHHRSPPRPAPRGSLRRHFLSTVIRFRVRLSRLLFQTAGGAALSAFPAPGAPEPRYRRAKRCAVPGRPRGGDPGPGRRGVAPRASAAVPGRREPELRRSATPLPGRPVHLAGEGGRCQ